MEFARAVAFGAHAFDVEVTAGGLLARLSQQGSEITIVHMTLGEKGHPRPGHAGLYADQKQIEAERAATLLGAAIRVLGYEDARLPNDDEAKLAVCDLIRELRPELVLTHWHGSWHKDHRHAHELVMDGLFLAGLPGLSRERPAAAVRAVLFPENWEDPIGFAPQHYEDITDCYQQWLNAIDAYALSRSGLAAFPYRDYYTSLARVRGVQAGVKYAEAFMTVEPLRLQLINNFLGKP
jgi:LmbE family N-acetylglucosaminyl deacetylase